MQTWYCWLAGLNKVIYAATISVKILRELDAPNKCSLDLNLAKSTISH